MISARLFDVLSIRKNQLYFYTLAANKWKLKLFLNHSIKNIQHVGINLMTEVQDTENYKALLQEIK